MQLTLTSPDLNKTTWIRFRESGEVVEVNLQQTSCHSFEAWIENSPVFYSFASNERGRFLLLIEDETPLPVGDYSTMKELAAYAAALAASAYLQISPNLSSH